MTEREKLIMDIISREAEKVRVEATSTDNSQILMMNAQIMAALQRLIKTINDEVFDNDPR